MFHVLLPVDESRDRARLAAETVIGLPGDLTDVKVTILHVQEDLVLSEVDEERVSSKEWLAEGKPPTSIENAREILENSGVEVTVRHETKDPAETIIRVASDLEVDQILMAGRKQSAVGKVLFGSTTQAVLLSATVPVTVAMK